MDEGWTRLVLEKFHFPYLTLHNDDIRAGKLKDRVDVLLIPSIEAKTLRDGYGAKNSEPAYVGGLGREGSDAIGRLRPIRRDFSLPGKFLCVCDR